MRVALISLPLVSAALPGEPDLAVAGDWETWKSTYGKTYTRADESQRFTAFLANVEKVRKHNADETKTWFMALNEFADLTQEEFKAMYTGNLPRLDKSHFVGTFEPSHLKDLPDHLDWREQDGVMTPVKNQGACGSCWAFSAVETLESHLAIATGEPAPHLSPQQVVSCSPNPDHCGGTGGCQGSTQPLAFNYTKLTGLSAEVDYPYTGYGTCQQAKIKPCAQNDGYVQVKQNDYAAHMEALQKGPVSISLAAMALQLYGGGILSRCDCDMDHAVQLVGYGTQNDKDYWLVRNSWGGSWGERGYVRIQRFGAKGDEPTCVDKTPQDGDACAGDTDPRTYAGLCGLLGSSSYPTGMKKVGDCPAPPKGCADFGVNTCYDCPAYCKDHGGQKGCSSGTFGMHCNCADGFGCSGVSASTVV